MFEFQSEVSEKKFKTAKDVNPVLYGNNLTSVDFYVLVDHPLAKIILDKIVKTISMNAKNKSFKIISALPFLPKEKDLKKSIFDLYAMNGTDLTKYIPPYSKVLTIGRGLYDVTWGDDLSIEGFYDTLQWKTSFYAPLIKSRIFPCPNYFSWLEKDTFEAWFVRKQLKIINEYDLKRERIREANKVLFKTSEECNKLLKEHINYDKAISWDTETKRLDPWSIDGRIICLTLCFEDDPYTGYFLPYELIDKKLLNDFFSNKKLVGNNSKYDIKWLTVKGEVERKNLSIHWDNMKGSHALNELQFNSLKSDAWLDTPYGGYDFPLEKYKAQFPKCKEDYSLIPTSILYPYACMDAITSMLVYLEQKKQVDEFDKQFPVAHGWSLKRSLTEVAFPAIETFTDIELHGMAYDWNKLDILSSELSIELLKRRKQLYTMLDMPEDMNIDSGDQLGKFLEEKGWENPGRSEKGIYLTNYDAMIYWKRKGHKEIDYILEYTEYATAMKTFVGVAKNEKGNPTGFYQYRKIDNIIHGTFLCMMADTWRNKSRDPNLQNIIKNSTVYLGHYAPITNIEKYKDSDKKVKVYSKDEYIDVEEKNLKIGDTLAIPLVNRIRECFTVPDDSYVFSENDGKGLQLRIAATYSHDPAMTDIFLNRGGDMHSLTAQQTFCPNISLDYFIEHKNEQPYKGWRKKGKSVDFGLIFGESSRAFAGSTLMLEWSLQEAKDYVTTYHLEEKQQSFLKALLKNIDPSIVDIKCWTEDQKNFSYYWASADDIRTKFFETYKGLKAWHDERHEFARKYGYSQSMWGPIRRTPYLVYQGKDDDKARIKNYENIVLNSPVQNFEGMYIMYNMARSDKEMKETGKKSYFVGNIHDSFIPYLKRDEMQSCKDIFVKYFHEPMEIMEGIPYEVEFSYTDCAKGEIWGITEHEF